MICYKDRTFCCAKDCKHFETCDRAFTEKVAEDAGKEGLLVALCGKLRCFEEKEPKEPGSVV